METRQVAKADGVDVSEKECLEMFNKLLIPKQTNKSSMASWMFFIKERQKIEFINGGPKLKKGIATPLNDLMCKVINIKEGMYI